MTRAQNVQERHKIPLQSTNDTKGQAQSAQICHFNCLMPILLCVNCKSTEDEASEAAYYNNWIVDNYHSSKQIKFKNNFWN